MEIDYIVPMVFHDDIKWRENFPKVSRRYSDGDVRYRSWGTEELLIRLVRKNMPWLRSVIILLAQESQLQDWMTAMISQQTEREPMVRVVYHREFMPSWALPTFNSRAMEMYLKDIPGISEMFLYGNDDMYPIAPLEVEDFFVDGKPCIHMTEKQFPSNANNFQMACRGGLNFVAKEFGKRYRATWLKNGHSIAPILKSTCEHLWERGGKEMEASVSPFRMPHNFNQYIYSWWQYFAGEYVDKVPTRKYVSVKKSVEDVVSALRDSDVRIVCVNDNECVSDYMVYGDAVRKSLEQKLN